MLAVCSKRAIMLSAAAMVLVFGLCVQAAPVRVGVGHALAISLKDEYRNQIIPLAATAGAKFTALYLTRSLDATTPPGEDYSFMDMNVEAFIDYDANKGYNPAWWNRFAAFLSQCKAHKITPIVSLYDFCCSGTGCFGGYNNYDSVDRDYVERVVQYLNSAGVSYIINIGVERGPGGGLGPSTAFLNDCIAHLISLGVSLKEQMCLSDELLDDHYAANDLTNIPVYVTDHGSYIPGDTSGHSRWTGTAAYTINDEEKMAGGGYPVECDGSPDSGWGGSGTTQQYINYLNAARDGIACLNFWHLKAFNNCKDAVGGEDMEAIFAPNQRAAILSVFPPVDTNSPSVPATAR